MPKSKTTTVSFNSVNDPKHNKAVPYQGSSRYKAYLQPSSRLNQQMPNYIDDQSIAKQHQRFKFSPNRADKRPDVKKPAWERLLERSYDQKAINLVRKHQSTIKEATSLGNSPRAFGNPSSGKQHVETTSQYFSPRREQPGLWKKFMDQTPGAKVQRNHANYAKKRGEEDFLSSRTLNPSKFASYADLLLLGSPYQRNKILQSSQSSVDFQPSVTGFSKIKSPRAYQSNVKLQYTQQELSNYNCQSPQRKHARDVSNNSHFKDVSTLDDNQPAYIGGPNITTLLSDRQINRTGREKQASSIAQQFFRSSTQLKYQRDFSSNISCLTPDSQRSPREDFSSDKFLHSRGKKFNQNLLTSLETGSFLKQTTKQGVVSSYIDDKSKKRIQAPYQTRNIRKAGALDFCGIADNNVREISRSKKHFHMTTDNNQRERSQSRKHFQGSRDMFRSQIGNFS